MGKRNVNRLIETAWKKGERFDLLAAESLKLRPQVDDTGKMQVGDGTYDMDFQIFVGSATESFLFDVGNSKLTVTAPIESNTSINAASIGLTGALTFGANAHIPDKIVSVNSATVVVAAAHYGATVLMTKADGATTFQLPTPAAGLTGYKTRVIQQANQNLIVNCATANKIVSLNSVTYNTVTFSTGNEKIGAGALCICDGAKWQVIPENGTATLA